MIWYPAIGHEKRKNKLKRPAAAKESTQNQYGSTLQAQQHTQ
jgi:hypothetical protein